MQVVVASAIRVIEKFVQVGGSCGSGLLVPAVRRQQLPRRARQAPGCGGGRPGRGACLVSPAFGSATRKRGSMVGVAGPAQVRVPHKGPLLSRLPAGSDCGATVIGRHLSRPAGGAGVQDADLVLYVSAMRRDGCPEMAVGCERRGHCRRAAHARGWGCWLRTREGGWAGPSFPRHSRPPRRVFQFERLPSSTWCD